MSISEIHGKISTYPTTRQIIAIESEEEGNSFLDFRVHFDEHRKICGRMAQEVSAIGMDTDWDTMKPMTGVHFPARTDDRPRQFKSCLFVFEHCVDFLDSLSKRVKLPS